VRTHRQADAVMDQAAEQPMQGPLAIELIDDQSHDRLHLFVRIERRRPTCDADIADSTARASPGSAASGAGGMRLRAEVDMRFL